MMQAETINNTPYIIENTLSEGSVFVLYKARCGTKYVILKTTRTQDAMHQEILHREYELGKTLSHACIVSTIGFEEITPVGTAIILEYIDGITLQQFLAANTTTRQQRKRIVLDILNGVDYLHHKGVLHNDLKPTNIMITPLGAARIIDFGLSASYDSIYKGVIGGSEGYTAPEILRGEGYAGAASDVYSIGLILQQIAPNKHKTIIQKCTQVEPSERYQNIHELKKTILLHQNKSMIFIVAFILLIIAALATWPTWQRNQDIQTEKKFQEEVTLALDSAYQATLSRINKHPYYEMASAYRGMYLQYYIHFYDTLPAEKRGAADTVIREHIATIDAQMRTLSSTTKLPIEEQEALHRILKKIRLQNQ